MIKFGIAMLCVLLPAAAAAQTQAPPPRTEPAPKRRPSMVGYINDSTIRSQLRVRFDAGYGLNSPDRAEFFYAKYGWYAHQPSTNVNYDPDAPGPWPGLLADGNFSQLYLLGEYGFSNSRASAFVELPIRWFRPGEWIPGLGEGEKSTGLSDIRFGAKLGLMSSERTQATILFQVTTPTGDAAKALGTNHASIEPAFLLAQSVNDKVNVEAQFGFVIPAGGSAGLPASSPDKFFGSVLYYGVGPSFDVYSYALRVAPIVELMAGRVGGSHDLRRRGRFSANDQRKHCQHQARAIMRDQNSIYVGSAGVVTDEKEISKISSGWSSADRLNSRARLE
jgi:hypothetical protein